MQKMDTSVTSELGDQYLASRADSPRGSRVVVVIQARMGSTRLRGKVLRALVGQPVLTRVVARVRAARLPHGIVIATTTSSEDDAVAQLASELGVALFRGETDDVLDRYYQAAVAYDAETVVRVTGDCPVLDPGELDRTVHQYVDSPDLDWISSGHTYPEGYGVEVLGMVVLAKAWREATVRSDREHVTPYIWRNAPLFKTMRLELRRDLSHFRLTVDNEADLAVLSRDIEALEPVDPFFGVYAATDFLAKHPEIAAINSSVRRQQAYWKQVEEERRRCLT